MIEKTFQLQDKPEYQDKGEGYLLDAHVYKDSVMVLLEHLKNTDIYHDYQIKPLLFLFRHFIELKLKGLILYSSNAFPNSIENIEEFMGEARTTHNLMKLLNKLKDIKIPRIKLPKDFTIFITHLDRLDNDSVRFRYPENSIGSEFYVTDPIYIQNKKFFDEIMQLKNIAKHIETVTEILENLETCLDYEKENCHENIRNNQDH